MSTATEHPAVRRRDVLASETTKIVTLPASVLMLALTAVANLVLAGIDAAGVTFYTAGSTEPSSLSSFGAMMLAPLYAFLVLPVYAVATEYRGGQLRVSLTATPHRLTLVLAKLAATLGVVLAAAVVAVAPARVLAGVGDGQGAGAVLTDVARWVAVYVLMSLVAFGLAGILRSAVAALGVLVALPVVVATGILQWPSVIRLLPDQAGLSLLGTPGYDVTSLPASTALLVLVAWSVLLVSGCAVALVHRDA